MDASTTERISNFLLRHIRRDQLDVNEDLFAANYVNSLLAMQLVQFVEAEFGIQIDNDDLQLDNFRSVRAIEELVRRKTAPAS